jgi:hypothetical protein
MAIYRPKESSLWWLDVTIGGRRIRESTGTEDRRKAQEYHDKLKAQIWEQQRLVVSHWQIDGETGCHSCDWE